MKLGFVSRIGEFPEKEWKKEFEIAKQYNLSHLELVVNYPFFGPLTYSKEQVEKVRKLAKGKGVELILHLLPNQYGLSEEDVKNMFRENLDKFLENEKYLKERVFNIASDDEKVREFTIDEIKRTLTMAEKLNAKLITIHGGSFPSPKDYPQYLQRARKTLEELNPRLGKIKLAIENVPEMGHFGPSNELPIYPRDLLYLVKGLGNIGICLDVGHANNVEEPVSYYKKIRNSNKIWNIHLHDNKGDKDDHLQLGKGNIDFKKFLEELKKDNYSGFLSIELDTWNEPPEPMTANERIGALGYLKNRIN